MRMYALSRLPVLCCCQPARVEGEQFFLTKVLKTQDVIDLAGLNVKLEPMGV